MAGMDNDNAAQGSCIGRARRMARVKFVVLPDLVPAPEIAPRSIAQAVLRFIARAFGRLEAARP